jgi:hypothetical protein
MEMAQSSTLRVGVDLDGVVADFTSAALDVIKWRHNVSPDGDWRPDRWDWWRTLGLVRAEWDQVIEQMAAVENWWITLKPLPGARQLADALRADPELVVTYITARFPTAGLPVEVQSTLWLAKHGLWCPDGRTQLVVVRDQISKPMVAESCGLVAMVDDMPEAVDHAAYTSTVPVLLDQPWNAGERVPIRVFNLTEFIEVARYYQRVTKGGVR